jgi:FemAB-related protein (PEP-CTERM system-associated)
VTAPRVIVCDDGERWDEFVSARSSHLYFRWKWREITGAVFGHEAPYLAAVDEQGGFTGVLPLVRLESLLFGRFAVSLPFVSYGGFIADSSAARDALVTACEDLARDARLAHVLLRNATDASPPSWSPQGNKVIMRLQLPAQADELWSAIGSKRRAQIKRPKKEGAHVRIGHLELLDDFYRVFARNMRDLGTPVQSLAFFRAILEAFPDETHLVVTYLGERPAAAAFLVRHGSEMEIPWASSLREFNRFGVNMLLYWEVLAFSIARGAATFDFGRSSRDSNTQRFKAQWGATPQATHWCSWTPGGTEAPSLSPDNSSFSLAIAAWQRLPVPVANLIGPRVVKFLP